MVDTENTIVQEDQNNSDCNVDLSEADELKSDHRS
jgi:hypothetical protein